jgi:hypothetical protein
VVANGSGQASVVRCPGRQRSRPSSIIAAADAQARLPLRFVGFGMVSFSSLLNFKFFYFLFITLIFRRMY